MQDDTSATVALAPAPGRVLGSDPHGFAALYVRHRASFTSHARRYLRDPRDADEVVQEAFLRLFLAMPELETELQALAYCRRTITNLCIDRYRADARRPRLVALEGATVDELAETDTGDPVVRAEDAALVRQALSQLPALHRAALVMREIEEKPLPVIADELDVAEDSVKHLLFRARRALRKLLAGTSVAPGVDPELTRGGRPVARGASTGVAGLLLLALLGLGSGPDLRAVPVVGVDLPDVLGVTTVADAVGGAVRDVVGVIVPGNGPDAASAQERPRGTLGGTVAATDTSAPVVAAPTAGGSPSGSTAQAGTSGGTAAGSARPAGGRTTTVVTVVDGRRVVTVSPEPLGLPAMSGPGTSGRPATPGSTSGPGLFPGVPTQVPPTLSTGGRDVPGEPVPPAADRPAPTSGRDDLVRSPRADRAVQQAAERAADRAADAAGEVTKQTPRGADRAAAVAGKEKAAAQAATKVEQVTAKAAEQADRAAAKAADKAADAADKAGDKAADKAAKAAQAAAAGRAQAAAAQQAAADRAAARAAAQAAQATAAQAAAAQAAAVPAPAAAVAAPAAAAPVAPVAEAVPTP